MSDLRMGALASLLIPAIFIAAIVACVALPPI